MYIGWYKIKFADMITNTNGTYKNNSFSSI